MVPGLGFRALAFWGLSKCKCVWYYLCCGALGLSGFGGLTCNKRSARAYDIGNRGGLRILYYGNLWAEIQPYRNTSSTSTLRGPFGHILPRGPGEGASSSPTRECCPSSAVVPLNPFSWFRVRFSIP